MFTAFAVGLSLTASVLGQVPNYVPTNGLVGYWPFNGNANDESGNGNNGTVNGATLTMDRFGNADKAYSFNGVNNFIDLNLLPINNQSEITFCGWLISSNSNVVFGHWNNMPISNPNGAIGLNINISSQNEVFVDMVGGQGYNTTNVINSSNWDFISVVYNGLAASNSDRLKIYINGQIQSVNFQNFSVPSLSGNQANSTYIGARGIGNGIGGYNNGILDDIGIWNRALNECEIQDLYNAQINAVAGSISVSPQLALTGSNVSLTTATNSTNVQWQSNPSNYGWQNVPSNSTYIGGTTNALTVSNVQLANHNQPFRVIASNGNCTDTSSIATIQIADTCITNVTVYDTLLTTVTDTLIINTTLSLPAPNNENTILIYPNPASEHITIDNGNFSAMAGYSIKIENNAGQQVFQSAINQAQFYVDLSSWTGNGLYFVHLFDPQNNTVTVRKIVL